MDHSYEAQFLAQSLSELSGRASSRRPAKFSRPFQTTSGRIGPTRSRAPHGSSRRTSRPPTSGPSTAWSPATSRSIRRLPSSVSHSLARWLTSWPSTGTSFPAALGRVRALPADKLAATVDFFGIMQMPDATYLGFRQQPLGASPWSAGRLPARDGIQGARNLRRQRRRAHAPARSPAGTGLTKGNEGLLTTKSTEGTAIGGVITPGRGCPLLSLW